MQKIYTQVFIKKEKNIRKINFCDIGSNTNFTWLNGIYKLDDADKFLIL